MVVINTFTVPVDGVVVEQPETRAYLNEKEIGKGTLYITESVLSWCDGIKHLGFSLQYPNIALHAARREPFPALYIMVDQTVVLPEALMPLSEQQGAAGDQENSEDEEDGEEEEGQRYSELLFCPPQDEAVQRLFLAMNQCQMLHPDPEDDDHDSDIYEDASEIMDDDNFVPVPPMDDTEEGMQGLHLGNGHEEDSVNGHNEEYDPAQFADD